MERAQQAPAGPCAPCALRLYFSYALDKVSPRAGQLPSFTAAASDSKTHTRATTAAAGQFRAETVSPRISLRPPLLLESAWLGCLG